ncbi:MAG TPA: GFA family protein [Steroidobacteraceae bacterium]
MDRSEVAGGCLCGAVRFRIALPPKWCAHCHCSMCRRAHGAGFVTWVGSAREDFRLESGANELRRYQSSAQATRSFCGRCGSMLFFESGHWPDEIHVTLAHLDASAGLEPQAHAYWSSRAPWADWSARELRKVDPPDHG